MLVQGAFRSAFLAASSVEVTAASQGTLSLRGRFGRGDFTSPVGMGEERQCDFLEVLVAERAKPQAPPKWALIGIAECRRARPG